MDRQSLEQARRLVQDLTSHVAPAYDRMNEGLERALTVSGESISELRGVSENGKLNGEIVREFVAALPGATYDVYGHPTFATDNHTEALNLRSSVVFSQSDWVRIPFYVMGLDSANKQVLLTTARTVDCSKLEARAAVNYFVEDKLKYIQRFAGKFAILSSGNIKSLGKRLDIASQIQQAVDRNVMTKLFNRNTGMYHIHAKSEGALKLDHPLGEPFAYLSNNDFIRFGTLAHLSRLALAFNKSEALQAALSERPVIESDRPRTTSRFLKRGWLSD